MKRLVCFVWAHKWKSTELSVRVLAHIRSTFEVCAYCGKGRIFRIGGFVVFPKSEIELIFENVKSMAAKRENVFPMKRTKA